MTLSFRTRLFIALSLVGDGRMQLVNDSARQMLGIQVDGDARDRYLKAIRHPEIVAWRR